MGVGKLPGWKPRTLARFSVLQGGGGGGGANFSLGANSAQYLNRARFLGFQPTVSGLKPRNLARFSALLGRFPASKKFAFPTGTERVCMCMFLRGGEAHKDRKAPE